MPNSSSTIPSTERKKPVPDPKTLQADAGAAVNEVQSAAKAVVREAGAQAGEIAEQAKAEISKATDTAREAATDQKQRIAAQVGGVAEAIGHAADELEGSNGEGARYARMIADNAQKLSSTLSEKSVDDLLGIAQDFGRKQPAAFIGAAALLGFAASRFVLASGERAKSPTPDTSMDNDQSADTSSYGNTGTAGRPF